MECVAKFAHGLFWFAFLALVSNMSICSFINIIFNYANKYTVKQLMNEEKDIKKTINYILITYVTT